MPWPTMSDYQDALQNPRLSFSDPELQAGVPVTDRLGLPKPITGGFASVYQVDCGGRKWAVRCFLHYHQDMEQRYASIGRCLSDARLPYTAGFQYLRNGVRIRGQWYPALKMEWVDGEPLNVYVERIRRDREALLRLAEQFSRMSRDLRRCNIAHGDLQHGNVMVVGGSLRLVDYDGMYVPQLRGMPSHEVGHPNYQHPLRSDRDFGPHLDHFSQWVIYLSIIALSVQPDLWDLAGGSDEQLLFSRKDFADPKSSKVLRALSESPSESLRQMAAVFRSIISCSDLAQIPVIDGSRVPVPPASPAPPKSWVVVGQSAQGLSIGASQAAASVQGAQAASGSQLPEWVLDHMDTPQVELGPPFTVERASVIASLLLMLTLARFASLGHITATIAGWGSVAAAVTAAATLVLRYRGRGEFARKASLLVQVAGARREIRRIEAAMRQLERDRDRLMQREDRSVGNLSAKISDLSTQEQEEISAIDGWLARFLDGIAQRREELDKAEADELAKIAKSTPVLFLGKRAQAVVKYYRIKREPLQKQEERAKMEAARKKDAVRAKYAKKEDPVLRKLDEVKAGFASDRAQIDDRYEQESQQLALQKWSLHNLSRELALYSKVTLVAFLRKVFFLPA
ncbi:MAG: hypothetical protein ACM3WU_10535 [Bacillota bacterium]